VTVVAVTTLTASPASVAAGTNVTGTFSGIASPTTTDWIGVFVSSGAADTAYIAWAYAGSCTHAPGAAVASGSCGIPIPAGAAAGTTYELRLFSNNGFARLATSNAFTVTAAVSGGFDSEFNGDANGWTVRLGSWFIDSGLWYTSTGLVNANSSTYYSGATFSDYTYTVRLWRNGCDSCANKLFVRGAPATLDATGNWSNTYQFGYTRDGAFSVFVYVNGVVSAIQNWTASAAIVPFSAWNVLSVTVSGSSLSLKINGTTVWTGMDTAFSSGSVGIAFFSDGTFGDQLWADYAILSTGAAASSDLVSPEQQALNKAANERPTGTPDVR